MILKLRELFAFRRGTNAKIVLATGTFDLFHYEHLKYLQGAKRQGDILVVAVKNNKCARLKGADRPIIDEEQRIAIVNSIRCVDYTVLVDYDEYTKPQLEYDSEKQRQWLVMFEKVFRDLRPDMLYYENCPDLQSARDRIFEKYGVKGVPKERSDETSTSRIIERINKLQQSK